MADKQPTPIRKRASHPQPIHIAPQPTIEQRIDEQIKRALYHLMRSEEQANILTMTYREFEAFWQRVMESE